MSEKQEMAAFPDRHAEQPCPVGAGSHCSSCCLGQGACASYQAAGSARASLGDRATGGLQGLLYLAASLKHLLRIHPPGPHPSQGNI